MKLMRSVCSQHQEEIEGNEMGVRSLSAGFRVRRPDPGASSGNVQDQKVQIRNKADTQLNLFRRFISFHFLHNACNSGPQAACSPYS